MSDLDAGLTVLLTPRMLGFAPMYHGRRVSV
jgi:hypothetical protein